MTVSTEKSLVSGNILLSRSEYQSRTSVVKARPRFLIVELTRKCNLSCAMCRTPEYNRHAPTMSDKLFTQIEAELFPTADIIDLRGWGESLILKEFPDRLHRAAKTGAKIRVVTNLSFRRPDVLDALLDVGAYIGVSIDSANPATLSQLRAGANLDLIQENLNMLSHGMEFLGYSDRLCLYVTCQRPAIVELESLIVFAANCGVHDVRIAPVSIAEGSPLDISAEHDKINDAMKSVARTGTRLGVRVSLTASLIEQFVSKESSPACLHPWTHCYISCDGGVSFCDHLIGPDANEYILGSLMDSSFEEIWNGSKWTQLRSNHSNNRSPDAPFFKECDWCYKNRYIDSEDLLNPELESERINITGETAP